MLRRGKNGRSLSFFLQLPVNKGVPIFNCKIVANCSKAYVSRLDILSTTNYGLYLYLFIICDDEYLENM